MTPTTRARIGVLIAGVVLVWGCAAVEAVPQAAYRAYDGPLEPVAGSEPAPGAIEAPRPFYRPSAAPAPTPRPSPRPTARPAVRVAPASPPPKQPIIGGRRLAGVATWYAYVPGGAAAGPALRAALGPGWRGRRVSVCAGSRCVTVTLSDWCACGGGHTVDLDARSFAALAPLSLGVLPVTVRW